MHFKSTISIVFCQRIVCLHRLLLFAQMLCMVRFGCAHMLIPKPVPYLNALWYFRIFFLSISLALSFSCSLSLALALLNGRFAPSFPISRSSLVYVCYFRMLNAIKLIAPRLRASPCTFDCPHRYTSKSNDYLVNIKHNYKPNGLDFNRLDTICLLHETRRLWWLHKNTYSHTVWFFLSRFNFFFCAMCLHTTASGLFIVREHQMHPMTCLFVQNIGADCSHPNRLRITNARFYERFTNVFGLFLFSFFSFAFPVFLFQFYFLCFPFSVLLFQFFNFSFFFNWHLFLSISILN